VEGSCAIFGEGKIIERGMEEIFFKRNFLGEVKKS
jgi:hypothetical protein